MSNLIKRLRSIQDHSDIQFLGGDLVKEAADEIELLQAELQAEVKYWEDKKTHEAMDCYVDNKELDRLRGLVKEAYVCLLYTSPSPRDRS